MRVLIVYDSKTGNTEKMAQAIADGVAAEGVPVEVTRVSAASVDALPDVVGVILGSPVYYGLPSAGLKAFIDASVTHHGRLAGKVGGAFASSGGNHSGGETTVRAILDALLVHGMVVLGTASGNHYGPVARGPPDAAAVATCREYGGKIARLVKAVQGGQ